MILINNSRYKNIIEIENENKKLKMTLEQIDNEIKNMNIINEKNESKIKEQNIQMEKMKQRRIIKKITKWPPKHA